MSTFVSVVAGAEASCALLFLVAGAGKASQAARGFESDTALRRLLRVPSRRWRWVEFATGIVEIATAAAVLLVPVAAGGVMAVLGTVFCCLLWRVKAAGIPGGCNCLGARRYTADSVGVRDVVRAGVLAAVGVAAAAALANGGDPFRMNSGLWGGFAVACAVLAGLSAPVPRRACGRPLLSPVRGTLRVLTGHILYEAMARSAGPFTAEAGYRRVGCDDEFWFTPEGGGAPVVFGVTRNGTRAGQGLTIRTSRAPEGAVQPVRRLPVAAG